MKVNKNIKISRNDINVSTSQPTSIIKLTIKNINYFNFTIIVEDLIYNNVFNFKDRVETYV